MDLECQILLYVSNLRLGRLYARIVISLARDGPTIIYGGCGEFDGGLSSHATLRKYEVDLPLT